MTTKKQKRELGALRQQQHLENSKRLGLLAQKKDREHRDRKAESINRDAERASARKTNGVVAKSTPKEN